MIPEEPTPPSDLPAIPPPATPPRKRRRWLRWTLGILIALVLLLLLAVGLVWYAASTESGTRTLISRIGPMIPGELTIGTQTGPLIGPLDLRNVHYKNATMDVTINHLHLAWKAGRLRQRMLDIDQLHAEGIHVALKKSGDTTENGKLVDIHLPVNIVVRDALIRDLEIAKEGSPPFRLDRIALDARSERARDLLHVRSLAVDGPTFQLRAAGDLNPVGDYAVNLQTQATYKDPKMPPFEVAAKLDGTLEKLGVDARLSQPFDAHVRGNVLTPMRTIGMDLKAQVRGFNAKAINPQWPLAVIRDGDVAIQGELNDFKSQGRIAGAYDSYGSGIADYRLARKGDDFHFEYLNLKTEKGAAISARGTVSLPTPKSELGLDLTAQARGIDTRAINPQWPPARVREANVTIQGRLSDFTSEGRVSGVYSNLAAGVVDYRVIRKGDDFAFERVSLRTDQGATVSARGKASIAKNGPMDVEATWKGLAYPLQGGAPVVVSQAGQGHITGTLNDYQLTVDAQLAGPGIPPGHWVLAGRGNQERMDVRSLRGDVLSGQLAAAGTVAWKPQLAWKITANGDGIDPAGMAQAQQWPGRITFAAASEGSLRNGAPYGRVDLNQLSGQLRGNPLAGTVHLEMAGDRYRLPQLDLRSGTAQVSASGAFTKTAADLDWKLAAPNLAEALPDAGGAVNAQGHLAGPWTAPRVTARGTATSLVYQTYSAGNVDLQADVDLGSNGPLAVNLKAANVGLNGQKYDTVTLTSQGTRPSHTLALAVRQGSDGLDLALAGGLRGTTSWSGEIRRLDLRNAQAGNWSLAHPAGLTAGTTQAALKGFCWTSGNARLCADGQWAKNGPWSANGTVAQVPFSLLKPFLPPDVQITGEVGGTFAGTGSPAGVVTADVDLRPGPGEIRYPAKTGETTTVRFDQGTVRVVAGGDGLTGHADLTFVNTGAVRADLRLPQYNKIGAPLQSQTLSGRIVANFSNLGLVEAFVPDLDNVRGALSSDLTLGGTVAKPTANGSVLLQQAQADVPEYNLQIRQVSLTAKSAGTGPIQIQGSARSGNGTVTVAGGLALDGSPSKLTLEGKNFVASNTNALKVLVSPNLQVALNGQRTDVTGEVTIPELTVNQEKQRRAAVQVSKDVIIVPASATTVTTPAPSRQLYARVRAVLGEKVTIKAQGFSGGLTGSLLVFEQPQKPVTAVGELEVKNGVYKSYGQDLTLEHGRIVFAGGPIDNPGLDLKAFRKATDGTVAGINVTGTLKAPQATLYSDPPMDESNALAYLLLGHPLGQSNPQEGNLVANAATSLGLKGGNLIAKKVASRFGLEEARIESTGGIKESSLVVGKYLSPRLYVNYGIGLFQPVSTFTIRYLFSRQWSLQAQQGAAVTGQGQATGVDVLYTVERGKGGTTPAPPKRDRGNDVQGPKGTETAAGTGGG